MKYYVDPEECISCGLCTEIAPEVFEIGPEGYARTIPDASDEFYSYSTRRRQSPLAGAVKPARSRF